MVFKLFGFKGSLLGRRKEPKEDKGEVVCIGYRVNPEFLDSLPPPVLQSSQASTSKEAKSKDSSPRLEKGKPNGNIPQGLIKNQPDHSNLTKNEVIKERKPVIKPAAKDLFKPTPRDSSKDDEKEKPIKDQPPKTVAATNAEVSQTPNTFSTHRDSDNDRKSTLIFLTENHDDNEQIEVDNRNSNIYEEMDVNKFDLEIKVQSQSRRSSTDSNSKINFVQAQSAPEGADEFVRSKRFISRDHDENPDAYSSQASSLFFGDPEPETVKLGKTKRTAPGRPSEADSETSA